MIKGFLTSQPEVVRYSGKTITTDLNYLVGMDVSQIIKELNLSDRYFYFYDEPPGILRGIGFVLNLKKGDKFDMENKFYSKENEGKIINIDIKHDPKNPAHIGITVGWDLNKLLKEKAIKVTEHEIVVFQKQTPK